MVLSDLFFIVFFNTQDYSRFIFLKILQCSFQKLASHGNKFAQLIVGDKRKVSNKKTLRQIVSRIVKEILCDKLILISSYSPVPNNSPPPAY